MGEVLRRITVGKTQFAKDNEYYTPKYVVDLFGDFDYDPATVAEKAEEFGIPNFDTIETDGLSTDWTQYKRIWINPPFGSVIYKIGGDPKLVYIDIKNISK